MTPQSFYIPHFLRDWPWRTLSVGNPYYEPAKAETTEWLEFFKPFSAKGQAAFNACDFSGYTDATA